MPRPITDAERIDKYVNKTDDCWLWTGALTGPGYGTFTAQYKNQSAHRWSYELHVGPVPEDLTLDHLCRVRNCVRPDHLEPVTRGENVRRGLLGALYVQPTVCGNGHDLTLEGATVERMESAGHRRRRCRECERDRTRRARSRDAALGHGSVPSGAQSIHGGH